MNYQRKTWLCDIDGTLLTFVPTLAEVCSSEYIPPLPGASEKTMEWYKNGDLIILTTARPEGIRKITEIQLKNAKIFYHHLLMNLPDGPRVVINDVTEEDINNNLYKAVAFNIIRNKDGILNIL